MTRTITFTDETIRGFRTPKSGDNPYDALVAAKFGRDENILLIDASGLCYRAYHTRDYLEGFDGSRTGVLHGVLSIVGSLCLAANTARWLLVWDGSVAAKRALHPSYKSRHDRKRTPEEQAAHDDMRAQCRLAKGMLYLLGAPMLEDKDCEADDLLGIAADVVGRAVVAGHGRSLPRPLSGTIVVSDDKDLYQTLSPTNRVWRASAGKLVDIAEFRSVHGFGPELYDSYKALVGEPATGDDIPGVSGIGEVNAMKMVGAHGELESLIAASAKLVKSPKCPKTYSNLFREQDVARLSRKLSRISRTAADAHEQWGVNPVRVSASVRAGVRSAVTTPRATPRSAIDRLRKELGFTTGFDARRWENVCGFCIREDE